MLFSEDTYIVLLWLIRCAGKSLPTAADKGASTAKNKRPISTNDASGSKANATGGTSSHNCSLPWAVGTATEV